MNTNPGSCPQCGAPLPANAPAGLCPRCVMAMNMASETDFGGEGGAGMSRKFNQPPTPEELAAKFPQLEILELLGRGGMGAVYKARQKELDRIVALKILPPGIGENPAFAERFSREAKALARLNHPGIVTIHDFGRADGLFYFLMEFVDGVNLRQLQGTGRISPREALAIVPQICDALQYAHDQGIVHRDIKPENILLDRKGVVKVADFGLAKLMGTDAAWEVSPSGGPEVRLKPGLQPSDLTDVGKVMGTPQYMAPEQKDRPLEVDHRADIYALGVVFYQMLTGELPDREIAPPSRKVQIDVRLDEIVLRALEKEPARRYQQVSEMRTRIGTVASDTAAGVPVPPDFPGPSMKMRWRDLWHWDTPVIVLVYLVPGLILALVSMVLVPRVGFKALWLLFGEVFFFGHVGLYMWIGHRIGQLRRKLPRSAAEVAEGIMLQGRFQAPGLAVLHRDRVELIPVKGEAMTVLLEDVASVRQTRWFNGMMLWTKKGFILKLADGGRVGMAIAAPFANRWRARLSGGKLPEIPADPQERPSNRGASPPSRSRLLMPLVAIVGFLLLGLVIRHYFPDEPLDEPVQRSQSGLSVDSQPIALLSADLSLAPGVGSSSNGGAPFGPVIERVLPDPDNGHPSNEETLQLRTGQMLNVLDGTPGESGGGARLHQLLASEADLTAEYDDHVSGSWVFVTAGLKFSDFPNRQWETATAADLAEALTEPTAMQHVEHFGAVIYALSETFVPLTLAFEARDGGRGLLQVTKFDHHPRRTVTIRYKLVQPGDGGDGDKSAAVMPQAPPVVIRTFPESGASGVDPALSEIRVTFSKPMRDGSWSWVKLDDATYPGTTAESRFLADGRTCVLPVKLEPGRVYATWVNSGQDRSFTDSQGEAAIPYLLIFETRE